MFKKFLNKNREKPPYLERIDELEKVSIIRLKGNIDREMVPIIDKRIQENRRRGSKIDKNILVDYAQVGNIDSAAVAFHFMRLKEFEAKGFKIGFVNVSKILCTYLHMFKLTNDFRIYSTEEEALEELNQ